MPLWTQISLLALTLGSVAVMQGLKLQQMSLLVAGLMAIAIALLVTDHAVAAGVLLALASIKPQLVVAVAVLARHLDPGRLAATLSMGGVISGHHGHLVGCLGVVPAALDSPLLAGGSRISGIHRSDVGDGPVDRRPWSWIFEMVAFAAMMGACWRERRQAANTDAFAFTLSLVLAATILLIPTYAPYNQVLLIPALLVLVKERRMIWQGGIANRVLLVTTAGLIVWPWISSTALAGLSFVLPRETVERAWALPAWTVTQIPVAVAALMLVRYYQRTFTASAEPGSS